MIQNTLFCKRARAAEGGRKQALVWEGYAARLLCHYITPLGDVQARQRQRKPCGGTSAPARARAARAAPEPTCPHRATQPARRGRGKGGRQRGSARARDEVRDRARPEELRGVSAAALGDSRAGQRARGAHNNAQARRHFYAATPEPVRRPPRCAHDGGRRVVAARSTGTRHPDGIPARMAGGALTGGFAREHLPGIYYLI